MDFRALPAAYALIAAVQLCLAVRGSSGTFYGPLAVGWGAAALHAWDLRRPIAVPASAARWICGGLLALAPIVYLLSIGPTYQPAERLAPIVSGLGLIIALRGFGAVRSSAAELILLSLPLITPLPRAIAAALAPKAATAFVAAIVLRLGGVEVVQQGTYLDVPGAAVEVIDACSGVLVISQLLALSVVVSCLFSPRLPRAALTAVLAVAIGFLVNAVRVAFFVLVVRDTPEQVVLWHEGWFAPVFAVASTALCGVAWWLVLRSPRHPALTQA